MKAPLKKLFLVLLPLIIINPAVADQDKHSKNLDKYGMEKIKFISPLFEQKLETNLPEFEWEKISGKKVSYEFRIFFLMKQGENPITLYERQDLKTTRFQPDYRFKPGMEYGWSVRYIKNKKKSDWAFHEKSSEFLLGASRKKRIPRFTTPVD